MTFEDIKIILRKTCLNHVKIHRNFINRSRYECARQNLAKNNKQHYLRRAQKVHTILTNEYTSCPYNV